MTVFVYESSIAPMELSQTMFCKFCDGVVYGIDSTDSTLCT